jgi:hypothetical protein
MAVFPLWKRSNGSCAQSDLARLPILAAAFLIALFGMIAGAPRNADIATSARPVDDRSDRSPALTKREPLRAVTVLERKDGTGGHMLGGEGLPAPGFITLREHHYAAAHARDYQSAAIERSFWPGALPRAPPTAA